MLLQVDAVRLSMPWCSHAVLLKPERCCHAKPAGINRVAQHACLCMHQSSRQAAVGCHGLPAEAHTC